MYVPAPDESIFVGVLRMHLRIPGCRTLKDRRRVVGSLRDRVHARHHAAFAEVGHLEAHDVAIVAVTVVGNDARLVRARLDSIRAEADAAGGYLLASADIEVLSIGGADMRS